MKNRGLFRDGRLVNTSLSARILAPSLTLLGVTGPADATAEEQRYKVGVLYRSMNIPGLRVLVTSGALRNTADETGERQRAEMLPKPYQHADLARAVRRVLDQK